MRRYLTVNFVKRILFKLLILSIILAGIVFVSKFRLLVKADEYINIFPSSYSIESVGNTKWQNPQNIFNQDLKEDALLIDFNDDNSAFIGGETKGENLTTTTTLSEDLSTTTVTTLTVPSKNSTTTTPDTTTTTISTETTTTLEPTTTTTTIVVTTTVTTLPPETTTTTTVPIAFIRKVLSFFTPEAKAEEATTTTTIEIPTTTITVTTTTTIPTEVTTTETLPTTTLATIEEAATSTSTTTVSKETITTTTIPNPTAPITESTTTTISDILTTENENLNQSSLIVSNFDLGEEAFNQMASQNVQLRFSLASPQQTSGQLIINYFYRNEWQTLGEIDLSQEVSNNKNGGYFLYALPVFENFQEFKNFKVKFQVSGTLTQKIYLDTLWVEVEYDKIVESKESWNADEDPEFDFSDNNKSRRILDILVGEDNIEASISTPDGRETKDGIMITGKKVKITKSKEAGFKPGRYTLKVKRGEQIIIQDFTWGVLTINTNKSIYLPGESVYLQMASLRDDGHTICNSNLKLEIISPTGLTNYPAVLQSGFCEPDNITDKPDYLTNYLAEEIGTYQMKLVNLDNNFQITSSFVVKESVPFEIERIGPTRIYPPATYKVTLKIKANEDFKGKIIESVPDSFDITAAGESTIKIKNSLKQIIWQVDWREGETYDITYNFKAPDVSPYVYLLGPFQIDKFKEIRQWQIASDTPFIFNMKTGYYIGDGNAISITGLGFKPQLVILKPDTGAGSGALFKTTNMLQNNAAHFVAAADLTTGSIQFGKDGFDVLGADSNTVNVRYTWVAFAGSDCTSNGTFCVGQYTGDGSAKSITTGFQPDLVWVKQSTAVGGNWRSSVMPSNYGQYFAATAQDTSGALFSTLDATGFTVGTTNSASAGIYYYVAFKNTANKVHVDTYAGAAGAQSITSATFAPDFVFVKTSAAVGAVYNMKLSYGNYSSYFSDTANLTGAITGLTSTGFDVGTGTTANGSGATLYYAAFGGDAAPSAGSGTFTMAKGSYTGTGNYINIGGLGFKPDLIIVKGDTAQYGVFRTSLMGGDSTAYLDAPLTNLTGGVVAITGDGFTIGTSVVTNTASATYYWTAYGNAWNPKTNSGATDFYIGAYHGNGIDDRNITGLPYLADLVVIKNSGAAYKGVWKSSELAATYSGFFDGATETTNYIQALSSDGFQVGTGSRMVNYAATLYFYFGFKEGTNFAVGTYSGNAGTNDITAVGFQPDNLWIKATAATQGVTRTSSLTGDGALPFLNTGNITNAITALISTGFSVTGTAAETNTSGTNNYRYMAWKNPVTFNQASYRFFSNNDSTDVGTALAAQNTPATLSAVGDAFRLRMLIHIGSSVFSKNSQPFKLLFAEKVGATCGDDETFANVTTSSMISFKNNTPNDGEVLTYNSNDPTHSTDAVIDQTYVESNNFTSAVSSIEAGEDGKWDFALYDNGAPYGTTYCFGIVKDSGAILNTYTVYPEVTTASTPPNPVVSDVQLNGQTNIDLTEGTTTSISATADVSDPQGCNTISGVMAKIYRSGVAGGKDCTANDNNCYSVASCTENSCSGNDATYTCTISMQFFADPTDTGTPWVGEYWKVWIEATDGNSNIGSAYNTDGAPEVNSLLALSVISNINYGNFDPGSSSVTLDKKIAISSTGNVSLDTNIYGVAMTSGGNSIAIGQQKYSLIPDTTYSSGTQLVASPGANANTNVCKNVSIVKQTQDIWWGIAIPDPQATGTYSGSNTFSAIKNSWADPGDWCELTGQVAYWNLDETTGLSATDSSGNGNTGNLSTGPTWANGLIGGGLSFDGTNGYYVDAGNATSLQLSEKGTISLWINMSSYYPTNSRYIFGRSDFLIYSDYNTSEEVISLKISNGTTYYPRVVDVMPLNEWHHLAVTYDGTLASNNVVTYFDGMQQYTGTVTGSLVSPTATWYMGDNPSSWDSFDGTIDDVRIYNRTLSADEILAQYNANK
ncbi:MAG: LamG domain-containing protein [Minisyncoccia bacterium]